MTAHINKIATAVPPNDVHQAFVDFASARLEGRREKPLFDRLVRRSQIEHRWSVLGSDGTGHHAAEVYRPGAFPSTAERMRIYDRFAGDLAERAVRGLDLERPETITHVVITSCTGLSAPGLDLQLIGRLGLNPSVERTVIGFMGCYAAINALKLAHHTVRSEPDARVLIVSLELCTLHMQDTEDFEQILSFLIFGDGCAAALVSAEPTGLAIDRFKAVTDARAAEQITWNIGDQGFDMVLSGEVPGSVGAILRDQGSVILNELTHSDIDLWAVHPGGRTILDAVEGALGLPPEALETSRRILRDYGNMSSATVLFVLDAMMRDVRSGQRGCAMAFGPGLTAETMMFTGAG